MIVALDERLDLDLEVTGREVVSQEDAVYQGLSGGFTLREVFYTVP